MGISGEVGPGLAGFGGGGNTAWLTRLMNRASSPAASAGASRATASIRTGSQLVRSALAKSIGRASCRERVCQYVSISEVAVSLKKKTHNHNKHIAQHIHY